MIAAITCFKFAGRLETLLSKKRWNFPGVTGEF